jgi:hypothetical protein
MSEQDSLFREVDEDLRREQMAALWKKYGVYVIAAALAIVIIVGGYSVYNWWSETRAAQNGEAHFSAIELVSEDKHAEALEAFTRLASETGGGYHTLAKLETAAIHAREGRKDEAVAIYDEVANAGSDRFLSDFASLQSAALQIDTLGEAEIEQKLSRLISDTNPWRYSAQELLALAAYRSGNTAESERIYGQLLGDPSAPADLRRRAEAMMALLFNADARPSAAGGGGANSPTQ